MVVWTSLFEAANEGHQEEVQDPDGQHCPSWAGQHCRYQEH